MKLNDLSQRTLLALAVLAGAFGSSEARAEQTQISWGAAMAITGDSDVINTNVIYAFMTTSNPSTSLVNGVTFVNSNLPAAYTPQGFNDTLYYVNGYNTNSAYGTYGTPFYNLSGNYQTVLDDGGVSTTGTAAIGFTGLTTGQVYQIQIFVDDSAPGASGTEYLNTTVGDTNYASSSSNDSQYSQSGTLTYNTSDGSGGLGQYIIGTFTAGSTGVENVAFVSSGNVLLNAVLLSQVAVPEPSSIVMVGIGCLVGLGTYVRRRRTRSN